MSTIQSEIFSYFTLKGFKSVSIKDIEKYLKQREINIAKATLYVIFIRMSKHLRKIDTLKDETDLPDCLIRNILSF